MSEFTEGNRPVQPNALQPEQLEDWNKKGYHVELYGGEYSVLMLGELHYDSDLQTNQIELIRQVRPELYYTNSWADGCTIP